VLEKAGLGLDVRDAKHVSPRNFWIGPK